MPEVTGKRVLIFGDSLSSGASSPGGWLGHRLTMRGASVRINAKVGRSAWNFYGNEDASAQLAEAASFAPNIAIVQLGTNDIGLSLTANQSRMTQLRDALSRGGKTEVWGVGPPSFSSATPEARGVDSVADMMQRVFGRRFIDMRTETRDILTVAAGRAADGVHFTAAGGKMVGQRLGDAFIEAGTGGIGIVALVIVGVLAWALVR